MQINNNIKEIQSDFWQLQKIEISKIKKYKHNNKIHNQVQIDQIRKSIVDFWYVQPMVLDKNNEIIIWHGRFEAIKQLQKMGSRWSEVDCIIAKDLNETQVRKLRLLDNKTSDMAEWNIEAIKFELEELDDFELKDLFGDFEEVEVDEKEFSNKEISMDDLWDFEHKCPKCWFEFNK